MPGKCDRMVLDCTRPETLPLPARSERTALGERLKATSQLHEPVGVGFAQTGEVSATDATPFEPGYLGFIEVSASAHAEKRLELGVED